MTHRRRCKSKNSQAKGLDLDGTLESIFAPTKQPVCFEMQGIFQVKQQRHENNDT